MSDPENPAASEDGKSESRSAPFLARCGVVLVVILLAITFVPGHFAMEEDDAVFLSSLKDLSAPIFLVSFTLGCISRKRIEGPAWTRTQWLSVLFLTTLFAMLGSGLVGTLDIVFPPHRSCVLQGTFMEGYGTRARRRGSRHIPGVKGDSGTAKIEGPDWLCENAVVGGHFSQDGIMGTLGFIPTWK